MTNAQYTRLEGTYYIEIDANGLGIIRLSMLDKPIKLADRTVIFGAGNAITFDSVKRNLDSKSQPMKITLTQMPDEIKDEIINNDLQYCDVNTYKCFMDSYQNIVKQKKIGRGFIDKIEFNYNENGSINVVITVEDALAMLTHSNNRKWTPADQRARYPQDQGFKFVPGLAQKTIKWNIKQL